MENKQRLEDLKKLTSKLVLDNYILGHGENWYRCLCESDNFLNLELIKLDKEEEKQQRREKKEQLK